MRIVITEVNRLQSRYLHLVGEFKAGDPDFEGAFARTRVLMFAIQSQGEIELPALRLWQKDKFGQIASKRVLENSGAENSAADSVPHRWVFEIGGELIRRE